MLESGLVSSRKDVVCMHQHCSVVQTSGQQVGQLGHWLHSQSSTPSQTARISAAGIAQNTNVAAAGKKLQTKDKIVIWPQD